VRQAPSIDSTGGGGFRVSGIWRPGSLLIVNDEPRNWSVTSMDQLSPASFDEVIAAGLEAVEFVLLGTGAKQALPPRVIRDHLSAARIGFEFMSTEAAARTYNVLASEGRRMAAALIAI
jgi:uncharacterized protein